MTHKELMKAVAEKIDLSPEETAVLWHHTSHVLVKALQNKEKIRIKNFGAFVIVKHKSRTVPDPRQMTQKLVIFDQFLPKFRPSEQIRALVKDVLPKSLELPEADELNDEAADETEMTETTDMGNEAEAVQSTTSSIELPSDSSLPADAVATQPDSAPVATSTLPTSAQPVAPMPTTTQPETTQPEAVAQADTKTAETTVAAEAPATPTKKTKRSREDILAAQLTKPVDIGYADLAGMTVPEAVLNVIPFHLAQKYQLAAIDLSEKDKTITIAMIDPGDREAIELISRQTGLTVKPMITTQGELQHVLDQYHSSELHDLADDASNAAGPDEKGFDPSESDSPAAKIVTNLLERAVREKASDIHIEPEEKQITVRFRIDGILQKVMDLPKNIQAAVISRLKILSNLKIDESRLPQDGRIRMLIDHKEVDFRLSTLPTVSGEKIVMRILDKSSGILSFEALGIDGTNLEKLNDNITKAHGMVLVTGPTGSGKTTTLYSVLGRLMGPGVNIITVEDPVEYRISGINQSQVNPAIGYDFASGLRSIVRQDPDIILIGEIRDLETATMAIHSALTGHIVLSTLHTNDAAGALPRLIDMGIEPFLITSSTNAIVAQRLVRRICDNCKEKIEMPEESLTEVRSEIAKMPKEQQPKDTGLTFYHGKGCQKCSKSGYQGRFGIYEILPVTEQIRQLALRRVSASELTTKAIEEGMITLKQDGILKALRGETTLEEVWRVTKD